MDPMTETVFYELAAFRTAVQFILEGESAPHDEGMSQIDKLVRLLDRVQRDAYAKGRISVQTEIIATLDLRHFLGP